jgi:hypothetical protein
MLIRMWREVRKKILKEKYVHAFMNLRYVCKTFEVRTDESEKRDLGTEYLLSSVVSHIT